MQYYVMVEEWLYPTESCRDIVDDYSRVIGFEDDDLMGDQTAIALETALKMVETELPNYDIDCGDGIIGGRYFADPRTNPNEFDGETGYMITAKNGLDDWYYAVRLIPVSSLDSPFDPAKRI